MAEKTYTSPDGKFTRTVGLPSDFVKLESRGWTETKKTAAESKTNDKSDTNTK